MYLFQDHCICESEKEKLNSQLLNWLRVKINSLTFQCLTWRNPDLCPEITPSTEAEANTDNSCGLNSHLPLWT